VPSDVAGNQYWRISSSMPLTVVEQTTFLMLALALMGD